MERHKRFFYDWTFPCKCVGGKFSCGILGILKSGPGVEIGFADKSTRYKGSTKFPGLYFDKQEVEYIIQALQSAIKE